MPVVIADLSDRPLDVAEHLAAVEHQSAGAVASFIGRVRDHDPGADGEVVALDYTAHPDAIVTLGAIAEGFDGDGVRIAVSHRIGHLEVGGVALVGCVSTAHRAEAFDVCRALVEAVKAELPVWKRQLERDGSHSWVGIA